MGELNGEKMIHQFSGQTKVCCSIDGNKHVSYSAKYTGNWGETEHDSSVNIDHSFPEDAEGMLLAGVNGCKVVCCWYVKGCCNTARGKGKDEFGCAVKDAQNVGKSPESTPALTDVMLGLFLGNDMSWTTWSLFECGLGTSPSGDVQKGPVMDSNMSGVYTSE